MSERRPSTLLLAYILFGTLHELAHLTAASWLSSDETSAIGLLLGALKSSLGRVSIIDQDATRWEQSAIRYSGWIGSVVLAIMVHLLAPNGARAARMAATVTALEAITTDLLGFTPVHLLHDHTASRLVLFCGNFGVLLLNPSWLSIDGGRTALDVLEKMVNVTMMRGAQSGGGCCTSHAYARILLYTLVLTSLYRSRYV